MRAYPDAKSPARPCAALVRTTRLRTTGGREAVRGVERIAISHKIAPIASRAHDDQGHLHANHVTTASRRYHGAAAAARPRRRRSLHDEERRAQPVEVDLDPEPGAR